MVRSVTAITPGGAAGCGAPPTLTDTLPDSAQRAMRVPCVTTTSIGSANWIGVVEAEARLQRQRRAPAAPRTAVARISASVGSVLAARAGHRPHEQQPPARRAASRRTVRTRATGLFIASGVSRWPSRSPVQHLWRAPLVGRCCIATPTQSPRRARRPSDQADKGLRVDDFLQVGRLSDSPHIASIANARPGSVGSRAAARGAAAPALRPEAEQ